MIAGFAPVQSRSDIEFSWARSRMAGIRPEGVPSLIKHGAGAGHLVRAANPVLTRATAEFDGAPLSFVLCDQEATVLDVHVTQPSVGQAIGCAGIEQGIGLSEEAVGTNAVGTVVEARKPLLVAGSDHFMSAFHGFACHGQPIVHPITRRFEGVLNVGGSVATDARFFAPVARRLVSDIEDRLLASSPAAQRILLAAFYAAAPRRNRPVVAIGEGLVMATPGALDLLSPVDHAALRAEFAESAQKKTCCRMLTLESGRLVQLSSRPVDGTDGVVLTLFDTAPSTRLSSADAMADLPVLILGETGSGRSSEACRRLPTPMPSVVDAAEVSHRGASLWLSSARRGFDTTGGVVVDNAHLLDEALSRTVASLIRTAGRPTAVIGDVEPHPSITALCNDRRETVPLRHRRAEIPRLASEMLSRHPGGEALRLTCDTMAILAAQSWPGNLAELQRVIDAVAVRRSAGDIIPADLPPAYREADTIRSPLDEAERGMIIGALQAADGNKVRAARSLGMSRSTLYNRMKALKIP